MKTNKDYTVKYNWSPVDYGEIIIPKGTRLTHQTAMGEDKNYHFVADWSWYKPEITGFARKMMLHDFTHSGVDVPKEYVDYEQAEVIVTSFKEKREKKIQGLIDKMNNGSNIGVVDICLTDKEALHVCREVLMNLKLQENET